MNAPFKQRENIEMFLKACESYGLVPQDLFQVNDLYEQKNLYMVVDNLHALGGLAQRQGFSGPVIGKIFLNKNESVPRSRVSNAQQCFAMISNAQQCSAMLSNAQQCSAMPSNDQQ